MLDPRTSTGGTQPPGTLGSTPGSLPESATPRVSPLRPGAPDWRRRWLAAVRQRMALEPHRHLLVRRARIKALAADAALWAEMRLAEEAYVRGEGEFIVPSRGEDGANG